MNGDDEAGIKYRKIALGFNIAATVGFVFVIGFIVILVLT